MKKPAWKAHLVTVCDRCSTASCWQGTFMCWDSRNAGTKTIQAGELMENDSADHPDYWGLPDLLKQEAVAEYDARRKYQP